MSGRRLATLIVAGSLIACIPAYAQDEGGLSGGGAVLGGSGAPGSGTGAPGMIPITPAMMNAVNILADEETRMMRQGRRMKLTPAAVRAIRTIIAERGKMHRRRRR